MVSRTTIFSSEGTHPTSHKQNTGTSEEIYSINHEDENEGVSRSKSCNTICCNVYETHSFLIGIIIVILLAKTYPPLGAVYLYPQITATWIAVMFVFVLAGIGLKSEELAKAFVRLHFNLFVQVYNFGVVSGLVYTFTRLAIFVGILSKNLADGMVICSCLPMTVNMVVVMTISCGGDEATAIFNAAFGNLIGVFLSPALILGYLGVSGDADLVNTFIKLAIRVVIPIIFGQIVRKSSKSVVQYVEKNKLKYKKAQEFALVYLVYTVFCRTFMEESVSSIGDILLMIACQFIMLSLVMMIAWYGLKMFFSDYPSLRVMGLFGCSFKTIAIGLPLIGAMYENDPNIGLYTLPLLIWHPMQLVISSALVPKLRSFIQAENEKLGFVAKVEFEESEATKSETSIDEEEKLGGNAVEFEDDEYFEDSIDEANSRSQSV